MSDYEVLREHMTDSQAVDVPVYQEYMNPLLEALRNRGQPLPIEEVDRLVIAAMKLSAEIVAIPHDPEKPDRSEVSYRMRWTRTYLKKAGLLENPRLGHWAISAKGRDAGKIDAYQLAAQVAQVLPTSTPSDEPKPDEVDEELLTARVGDELGRQISILHQQLASDGQPPGNASRSVHTRDRGREESGGGGTATPRGSLAADRDITR